MNYIIVYLEVKHLLNFLTREQKGRLLEVLIEYGETNSLPECDENVLNVFNFLKPRIDAQRAKAELKAEIARKNGSTGGRPAKGKKPKKTQSKPKETQWVIPTLQEIQAYCQERKNSVSAEKFLNYYQAKGWMIGKNKMKDWKAAVRTWEGNDKQQPQQSSNFEKWNKYLTPTKN